MGTGTENDLTLVQVMLPWPWDRCEQMWKCGDTQQTNSGLEFWRAIGVRDASVRVFSQKLHRSGLGLAVTRQKYKS